MSEKRLTPQQVINVLINAGWTPDLLHDAFRTVFFESSFRPDLTSEEGKPNVASYGLFQINPIYWSREIKQFLTDEGLLEDVETDFTEPEYYYDENIGEDSSVPVLSNKEIDLITDPALNAQFAKEYVFERHGWDGSGPDKTNVDEQGNPLMEPAWTSIGTWLNSLKYPNQDGQNNEYKKIRVLEQEVQPIWEKTEGPTIVSQSTDPDNEIPIDFRGLEGRQDETGAVALGTSKSLNEQMSPPSMDGMEETQSAYTNPDVFLPDFVRNQTAQQTDPRQVAEFQPNFMQPSPQGGAVGARQNMVQ